MDNQSFEFSEIHIGLNEKEKEAAQKIETALNGLRFSEIKHVLAYFLAWMSDPIFCPCKPADLKDVSL